MWLFKEEGSHGLMLEYFVSSYLKGWERFKTSVLNLGVGVGLLNDFFTRVTKTIRKHTCLHYDS